MKMMEIILIYTEILNVTQYIYCKSFTKSDKDILCWFNMRPLSKIFEKNRDLSLKYLKKIDEQMLSNNNRLESIIYV
jgi:hypothetical protein